MRPPAFAAVRLPLSSTRLPGLVAPALVTVWGGAIAFDFPFVECGVALVALVAFVAFAVLAGFEGGRATDLVFVERVDGADVGRVDALTALLGTLLAILLFDFRPGVFLLVPVPVVPPLTAFALGAFGRKSRPKGFPRRVKSTPMISSASTCGK